MHQMCLYPTSYTVESLLPNGNSELTAQSSRILEVNLRMPLRSKYNICMLFGNTSYPVWISGEFVIGGTIP
jgi:hypothetical protein